MMTPPAALAVMLIISSSLLKAQEKTEFEILSPEGALGVKVEAGAKLQWSVRLRGEQIIAPSAISLILEGGDTLGDHAKITSSATEKIRTVIAAVNYIKAQIPDEYTQLTINCRGGFGVIFKGGPGNTSAGDSGVWQEERRGCHSLGIMVCCDAADEQCFSPVCRDGGEGIQDRFCRPRRSEGGLFSV